MTDWGERLIRALCDPAWHDEILGDLAELRARRGGRARANLRYSRDVASIVMRNVRPRRFRVPALAVALLLSTIGVLVVAKRQLGGEVRTIFASDDAGAFTLEMEGRQVVGATLDGQPLSREKIAQADGVVRLQGANRGADLVIRVTAAGSIEWDGRSPH
jgi:hypothetical protein